MISVDTAKEYLRIDSDDEDKLIASLIISSTEFVQSIMRKNLDEFDKIPETVNQAILLCVATFYENRQGGKDGLNTAELIDLIKRMTFAYRREDF